MRCSAISHLEIILNPKPLPGPGSFSPAQSGWALSRTGCIPLSILTMMRHGTSGMTRSVLKQTAFSVSAKKTISGSMVPDRAVPAVKSIMTAAQSMDAANRTAPWDVTVTAISKSGIMSFPSFITTAKETIPICRRRTSIPVWGWSVLPVSARMLDPCSMWIRYETSPAVYRS